MNIWKLDRTLCWRRPRLIEQAIKQELIIKKTCDQLLRDTATRNLRSGESEKLNVNLSWPTYRNVLFQKHTQDTAEHLSTNTHSCWLVWEQMTVSEETYKASLEPTEAGAKLEACASRGAPEGFFLFSWNEGKSSESTRTVIQLCWGKRLCFLDENLIYQNDICHMLAFREKNPPHIHMYTHRHRYRNISHFLQNLRSYLGVWISAFLYLLNKYV